MANQETIERITSEQQQVGEVYAKALLGIGEKSGSTEALLTELSEVNQAVAALPKLRDTMAAPQISSEEKVSLIEKAFGGKATPAMLNFLKVVVKKNRFDCLPAVAISAREMHDQMTGKVQATLVTATEVDSKTRDNIASGLSKKLGKQIELNPTVDPSIIGGIVVRIGDTVYDSSVAGQLEQVRAKATDKAAEAIRGHLNRFTNEN